MRSSPKHSPAILIPLLTLLVTEVVLGDGEVEEDAKSDEVKELKALLGSVLKARFVTVTTVTMTQYTYSETLSTPNLPQIKSF